MRSSRGELKVLEEERKAWERYAALEIALPTQAEPYQVAKVPLHFEADHVFGERAFILDGLLGQSECEHLIAETERLGFQDMAFRWHSQDHHIVDPEWREHDRLVKISETLSDFVWARVQPHLGPYTWLREDDGDGRRWEPVGVNSDWRFARYDVGGHFGAHYDGCYTSEDKSCVSLFTVMLYLTGAPEDFTGGETDFIPDGRTVDHPCSVLPVVGRCLVFRARMLHCGRPVKQVFQRPKYIMRSDIWFRPVNT